MEINGQKTRTKKIKNVWIGVLIVLPFCSCKLLAGSNLKDRSISLLYHVWNINTARDSSIIEIFPAESYSTVEFKSDGNLIAMSTDSIKGHWKYDKTSNILTLKTSDQTRVFRIVILTEEKLILEDQKSGTLKRINLFRDDL